MLVRDFIIISILMTLNNILFIYIGKGLSIKQSVKKYLVKNQEKRPFVGQLKPKTKKQREYEKSDEFQVDNQMRELFREIL